MVTQQVPGRSEGQKAMDESLSQTEKVKRQLKAGRPRRTTAPPATVFEAVQRLHGEATRARLLMGKYGLDEQDIGLALLCRTNDPRLARILRAPLPGDGRMGRFINQLEELAAATRLDFLGILWQLKAPVTKGKPPFFIWITEFSTDDQASLELLAFKNTIALNALGEQQ